MNFLMIIPGLFSLLEKVIGPLLTSTSKSSIITGILGSNGTVNGIMGAIEGAVGKLQDEKVAEIKAEVQVLLAQTEVIKSDTSSKSIFSSWHAMFCWSMAVITIIHFGIAELFNILVALGCHVGILAPMDSATLFFIGSVLGLTMAGKTVERVNSNQN